MENRKKLKEYEKYLDGAKEIFIKLEQEKQELIAKMNKTNSDEEFEKIIELLGQSATKYQKLYEMVLQVSEDLKSFKDE